MLKGTRSLRLDVCDYNKQPVCCLYDNHTDLSGQATDVFVNTERNGWKELSFTIPSTCLGEEGEEDNYRLEYLIADYRIRLRTEKETDYYIISEPRIVHSGKGRNVEVTAGHVSQLLKTKNLNLEFSDEEGNNVGTAAELLATILEGTGWNVGEVAEFLEDDGRTEKVRSFVCGTKTGAFMMISNMCEKFDAKPIYHGDTQTVDIEPLNPFSEVKDGEIPQEVLDGKQVLELTYGRNMESVTRTLNTENLVTRLYAYGSYGDKVDGLCSLQNVLHTEYTFNLTENYPAGTEFKFTDKDGYVYYFLIETGVQSDEILIWSDMDPVSRSYIWNQTKEEAIYGVTSEPKTESWVTITSDTARCANRFDYLMDFRYYDKIGLLADPMKFALARFQRNMPQVIDAATTASMALIQNEYQLSRIAENNTGFLRLDVNSYSTGPNGELILNIRKTNYPDGIMYRSDYDEARRNYFSWYCAESLKENGDPTSGIGSIVYIVHDTNPITWEKAYLKEIDGEVKTLDYSVRGTEDPDAVTLWITQSKVSIWKATDRFYLFATNSISGRLGTRESEIESIQQTLEQATKVVTEQHSTYFVWDNAIAPSLDAVLNGYGWYYRTFSDSSQFGELYFCYGIAGETGWNRALISETDPPVINGGYYFNLKSKNLFHGEGASWVNIADSGIIVSGSASPYYAPKAEAKRISQAFSKVAYYCLRYDMLYKGLYDKYTYTAIENLQPGNYAFKNEYGFYWVFSTDLTISQGNSLWIDTLKYLVYQNENVEDVVTPEAKPYESIDFPIENELNSVSFSDGAIIKATGIEENSTTLQRSNHVSVYGGIAYSYSLPQNSYVVLYDANRRYLEYVDLQTTGTFTTSIRAKYARFVVSSSLTSSHYIQVNDWQNKLFIKDTQYSILSPLTESGDKSGINMLMKAFADTADACYMTYLPAYKAAQQEIKNADEALKESLGDLYREGYWQKNEYVEGDEDKLYKDALDNLEKISKPEATYDIQFLDLYSSNKDQGFSVTEEQGPDWPDIEVTDAVHLTDNDIEINSWAFIDKLNKCYDKPWKTSLTINTDLTLIAQHSFTDVLSRIAEVANNSNAKQTLYNRAAAISGTGTLAANKLEGTIKANKTLFEGGMSNWYTDAKGNLIFESADGQSAMMLTGYGFCLSSGRDADGDWIFRTWATGNGMTGDELIGGTIYGNQIYAGTITAEQLHASVGQELEIGSNKSLLLYATVDGFRPSGGLMTQVSNGDGTYRPVQQGDSFIQIAAKEGNTPAYIDIMTGGLLNLQGSTMNLTAESVMNLTSGDFYVDADGQIHMKSGSDIDIEGGASITVESNGDINLLSGADLNIQSQGRMNILSGGLMYVATGGNMYVQSGGNMSIQSGGALNIQSGSTFTVNSTNFAIDEHGNVLLKGTVYAWAGNIAGFTIAGDRNQAGTGWDRQYMYAGNTTTVDSTAAGVYLGTDGLNLGGKLKYNFTRLAIEAESVIIGKQTTGSGSLLSMDASTGRIRLLASSSVEITASTNVSISAGEAVTIASTGSVVIGNLGSPFTIGSDGTNAFIHNGMTSLSDTAHSGIYVGTDGIALGRGLFKVTNTGDLTAMSATILGEITATSGKIGAYYAENPETHELELVGGWNINRNLIYAESDVASDATKKNLVGLSSSGDYRIFAGTFAKDTSASSANAQNAAFFVMADGTIRSTKGSVGGWYIAENSLSSSDGVVGMYNKGESTSEIAFWAGNSTPVSAPFFVTHGGALKAVGAELQQANIYGNIYAQSGNIGGTISGTTVTGGWSITSNQISSNNGLTGLSSVSGESSIAFWAGNATPANANFKVTNGGTLTAVNAVLKTATVTGTIYASAGRIGGTISGDTMTGGWIIDNNILKSGTSTNYVGLSSLTNSNYAIWAGNETAANAPFYVQRDGTVYANNGTFNGKITAGAGSTIGGWYIGSDRIRSGNASGGGVTGMASSTATTDIAFWAGNTVPASAPFYVTAGGYLHAGNAEVEGTVKATTLFIGGTQAAVTLDANGKITLASLVSDAQTNIGKAAYLTITNGKVDISCLSDNASTSINKASYLTITDGKVDINCLSNNAADAISKAAGISVDATTGKILLSSLEADVVTETELDAKEYATVTVVSNTIEAEVWDQLDGTSGVYLTPSQVQIKTGGSFTVQSGNFSIDSSGNVSMTGTITAAANSVIGGWTIGSNNLHSGSGTSYVALDSGTAGTDYAIWAGSETAASSPFRVKRDGTTYVTALNAVKEDGTTQTVNLSSYPLWKLNYSTIKSHTTTSITLTDGTTLNFNSASSIDPEWIGGALYVDVLNRSQQVVLRQQVASMGFDLSSATLKYVLEHSESHSATLGIVDNYNETEALVETLIDASGVYINGQNSMGLSLSGSTISVVESDTKTAIVTAGVSSTYDTTRHEYQLVGSAYINDVFAGGSGGWSGTDAYEDGQSSMSITGASNISLTSSEIGSTNPRNINIYHDSTVIATPQINVDASAVYAQGKSVMGLSVNGQTISVTESETTSVTLSTVNVLTYSTTYHTYTAAAGTYAGSTLIDSDTKVSGTEAYEAGQASMSVTGASNIALTSSETGSTNPRNINIYHDNTVIATPQINVDASAVYSAGQINGANAVRMSTSATSSTLSETTLKVYTDLMYAGNTTVNDWTNVDISTYLNDAYTEGQASVSQRTAINVSPRNMTPDSTGKRLSGTCSVFYDDGTFTPGLSIEVDATSAYNAGWAAAKAAISISGNEISGPSDTVGSPEVLYTITAGAQSRSSIYWKAQNYAAHDYRGIARINGTAVDWSSDQTTANSMP